MESDEYYRKKYLKYKAKYINLVGGKQEEALILTKKEAIQSIYNPAEPIVVKNCRDFVKLFLTTDGAVKAHLLKLNKMSPVTQQTKFCEPVDKFTLGKMISTVTKKTQEIAKEGLKKGVEITKEVSKEAYKYMEPTLKEVGKEMKEQLKETGKIFGDVAKDVISETGKSLTTTIGTSGQALAASAAVAAKSGTQQLQTKIEQKTQQGVTKIQQSSAPKAPPMPQTLRSQRPPTPFSTSLQQQKGLLKSPKPIQKGGALDKTTLSSLLKDVPNVNIDNILETMQKFSYDMIIRVKFGKPMPDKQGTVTIEFLPLEPSSQPPKQTVVVPKKDEVSLDTPDVLK